jgi:hypothetical protein
VFLVVWLADQTAVVAVVGAAVVVVVVVGSEPQRLQRMPLRQLH